MTEIDQVEKIIAESLGMEVRYYSMRSKKTDVVELRFIAVMIIKSLFKISYRTLCNKWGGWEHDRIIYMKIRGQELIEVNDTQFMVKYIKAVNAVVKYLGKMYCKGLYIPEESSILLLPQSVHTN